jgi:hypothetical protein
MTPKEHASRLLFLIAGVLHEAVQRGQEFGAEQIAGTRITAGKLEYDGSFKLILTVDPFVPAQENAQAKTDDAETNLMLAPASR